jgi:hypothetical protein
LKSFADALGCLVAEALSELHEEKARMVSAALAAGTHKIQLAINTDPLVIVGFLRDRSISGPSHELFHVDASGASGEWQ